MPPGSRVSWLRVFENLDRAYRHFSVLISVTVAIIFVPLIAAFGRASGYES